MKLFWSPLSVICCVSVICCALGVVLTVDTYSQEKQQEAIVNPYTILVTNRIVYATNILLDGVWYTSTKGITNDLESVADQVKRLAKEGEICKVFDHTWRDGRPGESDTVRYADYNPDVSYRTCKICGKCESKSHEWK